jgi:hypothetical protein
LAILGIFCCLPLSIAAWAMGASDLNAIRQGRMDPSGQTLTQVGMILGIVVTLWTVVGFLFTILASIS